MVKLLKKYFLYFLVLMLLLTSCEEKHWTERNESVEVSIPIKLSTDKGLIDFVKNAENIGLLWNEEANLTSIYIAYNGVNNIMNEISECQLTFFAKSDSSSLFYGAWYVVEIDLEKQHIVHETFIPQDRNNEYLKINTVLWEDNLNAIMNKVKEFLEDNPHQIKDDLYLRIRLYNDKWIGTLYKSKQALGDVMEIDINMQDIKLFTYEYNLGKNN